MFLEPDVWGMAHFKIHWSLLKHMPWTSFVFACFLWVFIIYLLCIADSKLLLRNLTRLPKQRFSFSKMIECACKIACYGCGSLVCCCACSYVNLHDSWASYLVVPDYRSMHALHSCTLSLFLSLTVAICVEWTGHEGGEVKEANEGKEEQSQEDPWSEEGKRFRLHFCSAGSCCLVSPFGLKIFRNLSSSKFLHF